MASFQRNPYIIYLDKGVVFRKVKILKLSAFQTFPQDWKRGQSVRRIAMGRAGLAQPVHRLSDKANLFNARSHSREGDQHVKQQPSVCSAVCFLI